MREISFDAEFANFWCRELFLFYSMLYFQQYSNTVIIMQDCISPKSYNEIMLKKSRSGPIVLEFFKNIDFKGP